MDISTLISNLKEYDEDSTHSQRERMELLAALLNPYKIKFRYEIFKAHQETEDVETTPVVKLESDENEETKDKISKGTDEFPKTKFSRYDYLNEDTIVKRVIITHNRNESDFTHPITFQCNGFILDASNNWNALAVPCEAFNPKTSLRAVSQNYTANKYKIYKISDGTIITLYYYNDHWVLGTTNGYEMNNMRWMGPKTYEEMFNEITRFYPEFSLDKFDKKYSYCIGFKHHSNQIFTNEPQHAWFIQRTNLETLISDTVNKTGLPLQKPTKIIFNYKDLINTNDKALRNYLRTSERPIHYGYILRGDFGELGENSNVLLESTLIKKIRQLVYNLPRESTITFTHFNRLEYVILRAYINYSNRKIFIDLFPQFSKYYDIYREFINNLVYRIVQCYRNRNIKLRPTQKVDQLASIFIGYINKGAKINSFDDNCKSIIYDYVVDIEYIDLYCDALIRTKLK